MKIKLFVFCLIAILSVSPVCFAQLLDDEIDNSIAQVKTEEEIQTEQEELFDEMFSDYTETIETKDEPEGEIEELAIELADHMKKVNIVNPKAKTEEQKEIDNKTPIEGELYIGISKGSYRLFKDITGRTKCAFGVTLKSTLNKKLQNLSLRLVYPHRTFAFIFRNIPPQGELVQGITTRGDICYNLSGAPDINVNKCKIKDTKDEDCVSHIKWDDGKQKGL
jgi:hypothetical protein